MVNINVFGHEYVEIETTGYEIKSQEDMVAFLKALLDKVHYSGESTCLESARIVDNQVLYTEIERWK